MPLHKMPVDAVSHLKAALDVCLISHLEHPQVGLFQRLLDHVKKCALGRHLGDGQAASVDRNALSNLNIEIQLEFQPPEAAAVDNGGNLRDFFNNASKHIAQVQVSSSSWI